jgi:hypothetical protein
MEPQNLTQKSPELKAMIEQNGIFLEVHPLLDDFFNECDEDLCFFVDFPLEKFVFIHLLNKHELNRFNCTCTLLFLYQYFEYYQIFAQFDYAISTDYQFCQNSNGSRNEIIEKCEKIYALTF